MDRSWDEIWTEAEALIRNAATQREAEVALGALRGCPTSWIAIHNAWARRRKRGLVSGSARAALGSRHRLNLVARESQRLIEDYRATLEACWFYGDDKIKAIVERVLS